MGEREDLIEKAKVAEQVERYEDMAEAMKKVTGLLDKDGANHLSDEERNLLSVAYKNVVGTRRASWRILDTLAGKNSEQDKQYKIVIEFRDTVEKELNKICDEVINLLDNTLIPNSENESRIFYLKMKGDYYRYKVEVMRSEGDRKDLAVKSEEAYKQAYEIASEKLHTTHPIRLGLALNFSVYYYEIEKEPEKACDLAKKAFDDAFSDMNAEKEEDGTFKDSALIMQLLRDNLTLWRSEVGNDDGQVDDD